MTHRPLLIAAIAGAVATNHASGQDDSAEPIPTHEEAPAPKTPARFTLFIDNDGVLKPNDRADRYYTSGVKIDFAFRPDWVRGFADALPLGADFSKERTAFGVSAGQLIFTPWHTQRKNPPEDDHPYAGYLYGSVYFQRAEQPREDDPNHVSTFDHLQIDFGVIGPSALGEQAQNEVHRILDEPLSEGWSHQLHDEFALNMSFRRKVRLELAPDEEGVGLQLIPEAGFDVGNVWSQLVGGATVRFGQNMPDDYGPSRLRLPGAYIAPPKDGFGWQVFGRAEVNTVLWNTFLDGNLWGDSRSVEKNGFVAEFQVGAVLNFGSNFELGYSQTFQSEQFTTQDGWHSWGSLFIRALWTF